MILFSRDELVHGFILVYSTKRKASLANLSALSVDIPELPLQILAVTEPNGQLANIGGGVYMNTGGSPSDSLSTLLISEGSNLADRLNAHFMTSSASLQQKSKFRYLSSCLIHRNCTLFYKIHRSLTRTAGLMQGAPTNAGRRCSKRAKKRHFATLGESGVGQ